MQSLCPQVVLLSVDQSVRSRRAPYELLRSLIFLDLGTLQCHSKQGLMLDMRQRLTHSGVKER